MIGNSFGQLPLGITGTGPEEGPPELKGGVGGGLGCGDGLGGGLGGGFDFGGAVVLGVVEPPVRLPVVVA